MIKKESKQQTIFNQYLRDQQAKGKMFGFYELKVTTLEYLAFSKIEIHQYDGLQATEKSGLVWKWSDEDQREKVCDCASIPPLPSYIVIRFKDGFYIIRIGVIVKMRERGLIAITKEMAQEVSEKIIKVDLKKQKNEQ